MDGQKAAEEAGISVGETALPLQSQGVSQRSPLLSPKRLLSRETLSSVQIFS